MIHAADGSPAYSLDNDGGPNTVAWSRDGGLTAVLHHTGDVAVWDVKTRTVARKFDAGKDARRFLALAADGRRLVTGAHGHVWDSAAGREIGRAGGEASVAAAALSEDDRFPLTNGNEGCVVYRLPAAGPVP